MLRIYPGVTIIGNMETIHDLMFGTPQHDSHVQAWRWSRHPLVADREARAGAVAAEADRLSPTTVGIWKRCMGASGD